jgi:hypothetical protein
MLLVKSRACLERTRSHHQGHLHRLV